MPIQRIEDEHRETFVAYPETGMGYQLVQSGGQPWLVLNCEWAIEIRDRDTLHAELLGLQNLDRRRAPFRPTELTFLGSHLDPNLTLEELPHWVAADFRPHRVLATPSLPEGWQVGMRTPPPGSGRYETYVRYSAFNRDRRVTATGLVAGSYAAPLSEGRLVPSGFAAVGRFALPNPRPARFAYYFTCDDQRVVGTVLPAFGQAGGGVEALFPWGATTAMEAHTLPAT